jgi:hypothetical protein
MRQRRERLGSNLHLPRQHRLQLYVLSLTRKDVAPLAVALDIGLDSYYMTY